MLPDQIPDTYAKRKKFSFAYFTGSSLIPCIITFSRLCMHWDFGTNKCGLTVMTMSKSISTTRFQQ